MAGVLKKQNEMDYYASWAVDVKTAFNNRFL